MSRSTEQWEKLLRSGRYLDRHRGAGSLRYPPAVLARFATDDPDWGVRQVALTNPNCPPSALLTAVSSDENTERWAALSNASMPAAALAEAASAADPRFRLAVARNPNCPPELLSRLSVDSARMVQCATAEHPNCPVERIARFALEVGGSGDLAVSAARNPSCPAPLLGRLADRYSPRRNVRSVGDLRVGRQREHSAGRVADDRPKQRRVPEGPN